MSTPASEIKLPAQLRHTAESRLKSGTAPPMNGWATGVEALSLLHRLASNPATSGDALKLLHELQVHQVELDLQHEQMEQGRQELGEELDRYAELFDGAPVAYASIDLEGRIIEANPAAARLFGTLRDEMRGHRLDSLIAAASRPGLLGLLKRLHLSGSKETCAAQAGGEAATAPRLQVVARLAPGGHAILMAFIEPADCLELNPPA